MQNPIHIKIGKLGENIAINFLVSRGFLIVDRNFRKKYGEIDIVAKKGLVLHFIEVKSVSRTTNDISDQYRPEDNLHKNKAKRLRRVIEVYLSKKNNHCDFCVSLITIKIDSDRKIAKVGMIKDIIL